MILRDYQERARADCTKALTDIAGGLMVMPTGTGKTVVLASLVNDWRTSLARRLGMPGPVLMLAHRQELIEQLHDTVSDMNGLGPLGIGIEMATERANRSHAVVIASVASLKGARLEAWPDDHFGLIITDEAHHGAAETYQGIYEHFADAKMLGCTATPERLDGSSLLSTFPSLAHVYELGKAIRDEWLVPLTWQPVSVPDMNLDDVGTRAGDFKRGELHDQMVTNDVLNAVVKPTIEHADRRQTIVFAVDVQHAYLLAEMFRRYGRKSAAADGGSDRDSRARRKKALDDFRSGEIQFLCNCELFTEGVDLPMAACAAMARPTQSRALYMQMIGRITRLLGQTLEESIENGKPTGLIIDFVANSKKHRIMSALQIFDEAEVSAETVRAATKEAQKSSAPLTVGDALERAERAMGELARARAVRYKNLAQISVEEMLGMTFRPDRLGRLITDAQQAVLDKSKIKGQYDRIQASRIIDQIVERRRKKLCTINQMRVLMKSGLRADVSFEQASELMEQLRANRWSPTPEMLGNFGIHLLISPELDQEREAALAESQAPTYE